MGVDMDCIEFHERFQPYLEDTLDASLRESFREHLRACLDCRAWAINQEPTLVFAAAKQPDPDPMRVAECTAMVMSQLRQQRLTRRLRPKRAPWLAAAAAVLVSTVGATGWWLTQVDQTPEPSPAVTASDAVSPRQMPPQVQVEMSGEGIRVYQFADDGDESTAVYYIVNPALES
jgi:hypothetical protein